MMPNFPIYGHGLYAQDNCIFCIENRLLACMNRLLSYITPPVFNIFLQYKNCFTPLSSLLRKEGKGFY